MALLPTIHANMQSVLNLSSEISKAPSEALEKNIATLKPEHQQLLQNVIKTTKTVLGEQNTATPASLKERIKVYFSPLLRLLGIPSVSKNLAFLDETSLSHQLDELKGELFSSGPSVKTDQLSLAQRIQTFIRSCFSSSRSPTSPLIDEALSLKKHEKMLSDISSDPLQEICNLDVEKLEGLKNRLSTYSAKLRELIDSDDFTRLHHARGQATEEDYLNCKKQLREFILAIRKDLYFVIPEELAKDLLRIDDSLAELLTKLESKNYGENAMSHNVSNLLDYIFPRLSKTISSSNEISEFIDLVPQAKAAILDSSPLSSTCTKKVQALMEKRAQRFEDKIKTSGYLPSQLCSLDIEKLERLKDRLILYSTELSELKELEELRELCSSAGFPRFSEEMRPLIKESYLKCKEQLEKFMVEICDDIDSVIPKELEKDLSRDFKSLDYLLSDLRHPTTRIYNEDLLRKNIDELEKNVSNLSRTMEKFYPHAISKLIDLVPQAKAAIRLRGYAKLFAQS